MDWKNLIKRLGEAGLTQSQIAAMAGCKQSAMSALANGDTKDPRFSTGWALLRIARERGIELQPAGVECAPGAAPGGTEHVPSPPLSLGATVPPPGAGVDHPEGGLQPPLAGEGRAFVRRAEDRAAAAGIAPARAALLVDRRQLGRLVGGKRGGG